MAEFTIEITGPTQDQMAQELSEQLSSSQGQVAVFTETERALDPITIVSVVLTGLQAADIIWKWWQNRRRPERPESEIKVIIRTAGGHVIDLSGIDQKQLEIVLTEDE
jgi:hypothetical protein